MSSFEEPKDRVRMTATVTDPAAKIREINLCDSVLAAAYARLVELNGGEYKILITLFKDGKEVCSGQL